MWLANLVGRPTPEVVVAGVVVRSDPPDGMVHELESGDAPEVVAVAAARDESVAAAVGSQSGERSELIAHVGPDAGSTDAEHTDSDQGDRLQGDRARPS